jgi:hypothetical protein
MNRLICSRIVFGITVIFVFAAPIPSRADAVQYTLSGIWPGQPYYENFQYVAPSFVTSEGYVPAPLLNYCDQNTFSSDSSCWYIGFFPGWSSSYDLLTFNTLSCPESPTCGYGTRYLYFPVNSLSTFGVHYYYGGNLPGDAVFTLSVTSVPTPDPAPTAPYVVRPSLPTGPSVPEPSTLALLGAGGVLMAGIRVRRS